MVKPAFRESDKILCFHGPLIYEAKILKVEIRKAKDTETPWYFVHYKGWKSTWDEWVDEDRTLRLNLENLARQKQLNEAQRERDRQEREALQEKERQFKNARRAANNNLGTDLASSRGTKRGRDSASGDHDVEIYKKPEIKLTIPDSLKVKLVDDWEFVTKNSQLVSLPRSPNVQEILERYKAQLEKDPSVANKVLSSPSLAREVTAGLQLYFDKALGNSLLYRFERPKYSEIRKKYGDDAEMSTIYGAEHLLRLFVKLPDMVSHTTMDVESITVLREFLTDFLKWMSKEQEALFLSEYDNTSSGYQNIARA